VLLPLLYEKQPALSEFIVDYVHILQQSVPGHFSGQGSPMSDSHVGGSGDVSVESVGSVVLD